MKITNLYRKFCGLMLFCFAFVYSQRAWADMAYDANGFSMEGESYQPAVLNDLDPENKYYEISNAGQLYWFASLINNAYLDSKTKEAVLMSNAKLMADIVVNDGSFDDDGVFTARGDVEPSAARAWACIGTGSNSPISRAITPQEAGTMSFAGTYEKINIQNEKGYFISNDAFWDIEDYSTKNIWLNPFRAYLAGMLNTPSKKLSITTGNITAVDALNADQQGLMIFYDLQGRRLKEMQKGVNIVKQGSRTYKIIMKKVYSQPQMVAYKITYSDIICTSNTLKRGDNPSWEDDDDVNAE